MYSQDSIRGLAHGAAAYPPRDLNNGYKPGQTHSTSMKSFSNSLPVSGNKQKLRKRRLKKFSRQTT